jgi:predicted DNA-binding transcriptional regulator YafY
MDRAERLDLLLRIIRDRPGVTAEQIAAELKTSARSVFRDVAYLRDRGHPVEASRGRGGGLRLHPRYGLGRVVLTVDEGLSVLLSLAVVEHMGMPMFNERIGTARRKLIDAFPASDKARLAPLRARVLVGPAASPRVAASYGTPDRTATAALQSAFVNLHVVTCSYVKEGGAETERRLEPHAILLNWPAWYLLAIDVANGEVRTFRLDRFTRVQVEAQTFRPRPSAILKSIEGFLPRDSASWRL